MYYVSIWHMFIVLCWKYTSCSQCMQVIREFDRIQEAKDGNSILELWRGLIPIIYKIAEKENKAAINNLLVGADEFSEGMLVYMQDE